MNAVADERLGVADERTRSRDAEPELVVGGRLRPFGEEPGPFERLAAREDRGERDAVPPQETREVDPRGNAPRPRPLSVAETPDGAEDELRGRNGLEGGDVRLEPAGMPEVVVVEERDEGRRDPAESRVPNGAS